MSTVYKLSSEAKLKIGVTADEVEAFILETQLPGSTGKSTKDLDQFFVEHRAGGLYAVIGINNKMAYVTVNDYDTARIELVKKYAEFSNGAVEVNSSGDDFDEIMVWYIGPKGSILAARLRAIDAKMSDLQSERDSINIDREVAEQDIVVDIPTV